jgi:hypothetical protein
MLRGMDQHLIFLRDPQSDPARFLLAILGGRLPQARIYGLLIAGARDSAPGTGPDRYRRRGLK